MQANLFGLSFREFAPRATEIVRKTAATFPTFNADDVRHAAAVEGLLPASPNFWGSVFADMASRGEIMKHGATLNSRRGLAKARLLQGWRGAACLTTRQRMRNVVGRFFAGR